MAIYSGFTHQKWWFSIAMLVYQRVNQAWLAGKSPKKLVTSHGDFMYWESWGFLKDGRGLEEKLAGASSSYAALVWWCLTTRGHFWHFLASLQWTPLRIQDLADFCCGGEELPPDSPESLGGHRSIEILCRKPLYLRGNQMAKPWFPSVSCRFSLKPIHSPSLSPNVWW